MKIKVEAKQDHLQRLVDRSSPFVGLCELIWNALDGDATTVRIHVEKNDLGGLERVTVADDGSGIPFDRGREAFGSLGASWKRYASTTESGRYLHGQKGEGRFMAFAIGDRVQWQTQWRDRRRLLRYTIRGDRHDLRSFSLDDEPEPTGGQRTGTEVVVSSLLEKSSRLLDSQVRLKLAREFAVYLKNFPHVSLFFDDERIDPTSIQAHCADYRLDVADEAGQPLPAELTVIEWNHRIDPTLVFCDEHGIALTAPKKVTRVRKGFDYTGYIRSPFLRENVERIDADMDPDISALTVSATDTLRDHFRRRAAEQARSLVEQWKSEKVYPFEHETDDPVEQVERQVFDVVAMNLHEHLPKFAAADTRSKRFSFEMLRSAIERSPREVRRIIEEVLELPKAKAQELHELLEETTLTAVVSAARFVVDRLKFLRGLEAILFSPDGRQHLLERTQLHRMLAENTWIFGEEYNLSVDDKGLTTVLRRHLEALGAPDRGDLAPVRTENGNPAIVDLMLSRRIPRGRPDELEHLVVELKRPNVEIDSNVVAQVVRYADAVANDDQFQHSKVKWVFIAVSNSIHRTVKSAHFNQVDTPDGRVSRHRNPAYEIWVLPWSHIIDRARRRLYVMQQQLQYQASSAEGLAHLQRLYNRYLPAALARPETATPSGRSAPDGSSQGT